MEAALAARAHRGDHGLRHDPDDVLRRRARGDRAGQAGQLVRRAGAAWAACAAAVALTLTGCASSTHTPTPRQTGLQYTSLTGRYAGFGLSTPRPRPSFTLTDDRGEPFAFGSATAGHPTLLFFGYTRCPDECPTTMADIRIALTKVPPELQRRTYVVFVSTDVEHDTAPVIAAWLAKFSGGVAATYVGLHGTRQQVDAAQAAAHVFLAEDGGQTHSTQVLLYGPDDYARVSFVVNGNEADQIAHDLPVVASAG
ncbi:MAG: SCO family protein [Jatrophihabitans sp.]|nr:MAG: SCO family protein [Jatrophihabitans sp.]